MSWQKGRRWMGEGSSPDGHHDTWPDFKLERQHMLMGRSQERPPCVCHLATAGISGHRLVTERREGPCWCLVLPQMFLPSSHKQQMQ